MGGVQRRFPRAITCSEFPIFEKRTDGRGWDDGERPQEVFVQSLQGHHKVIDPSSSRTLLAQPSDELKAQLRGEAAQILEPHVL